MFAATEILISSWCGQGLVAKGLMILVKLQLRLNIGGQAGIVATHLKRLLGCRDGVGVLAVFGEGGGQ